MAKKSKSDAEQPTGNRTPSVVRHTEEGQRKVEERQSSNIDKNAGLASPSHPTTAAQRRRVSEDEASSADHGPLADGVKSSVAGSTWVALCIGAALLVLLLVFIVQNLDKVDVKFISWTTQLPTGVAMLVSALVGATIMMLVGGVRMLELRRQVKKLSKK